MIDKVKNSIEFMIGRISSVSAIGRPPDPRYRTNLAIIVIAAIVTVVGGGGKILSGVGLLTGLGWGIIAGMKVFLAWAISRELDPDYPYSAFAGAGLALVGLLLFELSGLAFLFWILVILRVINRTGGPPATWIDSLGVLGWSYYLTFRDFWLVGLITTVVFLVDGLLEPPNRKQLLFSALSLVGTILMTVFPMIQPPSALGTATWVVLGTASLLMLLVIGTSQEVQAVGDFNQKPLNARRVQAAQVLALLVGILMIVVEGAEGLVTSLPLWAAIFGVGLYRVFVLATGAGQGGP